MAPSESGLGALQNNSAQMRRGLFFCSCLYLPCKRILQLLPDMTDQADGPCDHADAANDISGHSKFAGQRRLASDCSADAPCSAHFPC